MTPPVRLHIDLNKTVLLSDIASGKSVPDVINALIADSAYGYSTSSSWTPYSTTLYARNPSPNDPCVCSYSFYLANILLPFPPATGNLEEDRVRNQAIRDKRTVRSCHFTEIEEGKSFRHIFDQVFKKSNTCQDEIIPSFYSFIKFVHNSNLNIKICFRTFGQDSEIFVPKYNSFCESIGAHNLTITKSAVFFRGQNDDVILAEKSLEVLPITFSMEQATEFYKSRGCIIHRGFAEISAFFNNSGNISIRDHYSHWSAHGESNNSGKLMIKSTNISDEIPIFMDDNIRIRVQDKNIVDVRDQFGNCLCKKEAFENGNLIIIHAIFGFLKDDYFIDILLDSLDKLGIK
ncbi:hypothetical protein P9112_007294 [Eukaryota sp. TZLM1-RC]